jgi:hypothetical protein
MCCRDRQKIKLRCCFCILGLPVHLKCEVQVEVIDRAACEKFVGVGRARPPWLAAK